MASMRASAGAISIGWLGRHRHRERAPALAASAPELEPGADGRPPAAAMPQTLCLNRVVPWHTVATAYSSAFVGNWGCSGALDRSAETA